MKKILISLLLLGGVLIVREVGAQAALPRLIITWSADSFVPVDFPGKALPTTGSDITAYLQVEKNGAFENIEDEDIRWFVNDEVKETGTGLRSVKFRVNKAKDGKIRVKAQLPNFDGETYAKTIEIPVRAPEVYIKANSNLAEPKISAEALLFYFNVSQMEDASFSWFVNQKPVVEQEEENKLSISTDAATTQIKVIATDPSGGKAEFLKTFTYNP